MRIQNSSVTIAELRDMFARKDLIINRDYQRHTGIWPKHAKSYFIDTILNGYPFPKVYLYESLIGATKKIRREIVDGQQRITTINEFARDELVLTNSHKYRGLRFSTLDDEQQNAFLSYSVHVDMILSADQSEILEMFRRMNAFTTPLNAAEKRHSEFGGEFKWAINELADEYTPMLVSFGVLTQKQVVRMADAELITEFVQVAINGIVNKSDNALKRLYEDNDTQFANREEILQKLKVTLDFVRENLGEFAGGFLFKSYVLYSLIAALMYNRWGSQPWSEDLPAPAGQFWANADIAKANLNALCAAHETREVEGPFAEYVAACLSTTHRVAQRSVRAKWLLSALGGPL